MKCDKCGWEIAGKDYNGSGECFSCFEGLMRKGENEIMELEEKLEEVKSKLK